MPFPALAALALLARIIGLGLERPWVKALGQGRSSVAATTLSFGIAAALITPLALWQLCSGGGHWADIPCWLPFACASGVLYAIGFHSYVYGMSRGEVSYLTPLYATAFVWLYALDVLFGSAHFGLRSAAGILAVTVGLAFLNTAPNMSWGAALYPLTMLRRPGAIGMLTYAFCLATGRIIDSHAMGASHGVEVPYAFIANTPAVLFGLAWLAARRELALMPQLLRERPVPALGSAVVGIGAYIALLAALRLGVAASVAEPVSQLSVFLSIALGGLWFHEHVRARWLPAALLVLGAGLLVV